MYDALKEVKELNKVPFMKGGQGGNANIQNTFQEVRNGKLIKAPVLMTIFNIYTEVRQNQL
jgi:hypothetical protein